MLRSIPPFCIFSVIFPAIGFPPRCKQQAHGKPSFPAPQPSEQAASSLSGVCTSHPLGSSSATLSLGDLNTAFLQSDGVIDTLLKAIKIQKQGKEIDS